MEQCSKNIIGFKQINRSTCVCRRGGRWISWTCLTTTEISKLQSAVNRPVGPQLLYRPTAKLNNSSPLMIIWKKTFFTFLAGPWMLICYVRPHACHFSSYNPMPAKTSYAVFTMHKAINVHRWPVARQPCINIFCSDNQSKGKNKQEVITRDHEYFLLQL
jgi:hypothetical protein